MSSPADALAHKLESNNIRIVLAESCTAGMASALLAGVPGISRFHCGSLVTYREASKQAWLGVSASLLERFSAVSAEVSQAMARGALQATPEAGLAAAITGHLGPDAPQGLDGVCYLAIALRAKQDEVRIETAQSASPRQSAGPESRSRQPDSLIDQRQVQLVATSRTERQLEAAQRLLSTAASALSD